MKYIIAILATSLAFPANAFEPHVERLIGQYYAFDDICRGSSGDNPVTIEACHSRDEVSMLLEREGLCYGKNATEAFQQKWEEC